MRKKELKILQLQISAITQMSGRIQDNTAGFFQKSRKKMSFFESLG